MTELATLNPPTRPLSLVERTAQVFGVDADKLLTTMKQTCFRQSGDRVITNEQLAALLIVREQYNLNPFTKELFAFDDKRGGIIPYVSIDGWSRIVNEHPQFDGMQFTYEANNGDASITCIMFRKDRSHPTVVSEYLNECRRETEPWKKSPRRMLRHKALMQCARLAFGFAGLYDRDEAERILESMSERTEPVEPPASTQRANLHRILHTTREHIAQPITDVTDISQAGGVGTEGTDGADPLADLMVELNSAPDRDAASEVLERACAMLGAEELGQLQLAFEQRFNED